MNSPNQAGSRMFYENSAQAITDAFVASGYSQQAAQAAMKDAVLSQSYLRLEAQISATTTLYTLPVLNNQSGTSGQAQRPTENRLNQQDAFYVGGMNMYISKAASTTSTILPLSTFPNPITFPLAAAASGGNPFWNLYGGQLTVTINNYKKIPSFDLWRFWQSPQTQLTGATNSPQDEIDGTQMEFMEPNPVFIGTKKNEFQLTLPNPISTLEATPTYIVFILRGVLAQNVTIVS